MNNVIELAKKSKNPCYVGYKAKGMGFDAHLTIVYFGYDASQETIDKVTEAVASFKPPRISFAERGFFDLFGPGAEVPVIRVNVHNVLYDFRSALEEFSASEFPDWNPHITLDLRAPIIRIPETIKLMTPGVY